MPRSLTEWWTAIVAPLLAGALAWGATYGTMAQTIADHDRRIVRIEQLADQRGERVRQLEANDVETKVWLGIVRDALDKLTAQQREIATQQSERFDRLVARIEELQRQAGQPSASRPR